nr:MAG TPA: hypothetical protein [Caudoviricetes sp.]
MNPPNSPTWGSIFDPQNSPTHPLKITPQNNSIFPHISKNLFTTSSPSVIIS